MKCVPNTRRGNWIRDGLEDGSLSADRVLQYIEQESNHKVVRQAAHDLVRYSSCDVTDEFKIVIQLYERFQQGFLSNAGAVLAGILDVGDRRINTLLRFSRRTMTRWEVHEFTRTDGSEIHAASVEFFLEWLLELNPGQDNERLRLISSSLMLMLLNDTTGWVVDQDDTLQVGVKEPVCPVHRRFEDYLPTVEKVLSKVLVKHGEPEIIKAALTAWRVHVKRARTLRLEIEAAVPASASRAKPGPTRRPIKKTARFFEWA